MFAHRAGELLGRAVVGDRVRRALPDAVEPVAEDPHLGTPRRVAGDEGRIREALLQPVEDDGRVDDDLVAGEQHGDEPLPAYLLYR